MEILYCSHEQMYAGIAELVHYGLAFVADHDGMKVRLTGELIQ
jgi:hypothetical protein